MIRLRRGNPVLLLIVQTPFQVDISSSHFFSKLRHRHQSECGSLSRQICGRQFLGNIFRQSHRFIKVAKQQAGLQNHRLVACRRTKCIVVESIICDIIPNIENQFIPGSSAQPLLGNAIPAGEILCEKRLAHPPDRVRTGESEVEQQPAFLGRKRHVSATFHRIGSHRQSS